MSPIEQVIAQYSTAQLRIKELEARQKPLKEEITEFLLANGTEDVEKLHVKYLFDSPIGDVKGVNRMRKVSTKLDMDAAEELLTEKGLFYRCTKQITTIDEDAVLAARYEELLTAEDLNVIFPQTVSWAIVLEK